MPVPCPLCGSIDAGLFYRDKLRPYMRCRSCQLIFVTAEYYLSPAEEKGHYDLHENNPEDAGYRRFLNRVCDPLSKRLAPASKGLDFGCGPGPTLSLMLEEKGHHVALYDAYFADNKNVFDRPYDFVTATEVVEHLSRPGAELARLWGLIKAGGWLGLMTKLARDAEAFSRWHYKNDPTHICFFSRETFIWLGRMWGAEPEFIGEDVILFAKPSASGE